MSTSAQFSEKNYEEHLKYELMTGPGRLWSPDTVLERRMGIDGVIEAKLALWTLLGRPLSPGLSGGVIAAFLPNHVDNQGLAGVGFKANLLLQAKRSRWFQRRNAAARGQGWNAPYWCFHLTPHQQAVLVSLDAHCGANALVTYASAAFHTTKDLSSHATAGSLVANTTWPSPPGLTGHQRWLYAAGGATGIANAEYRYIEMEPVDRRVETYFDGRTAVDDDSLGPLWDSIRRLLAEEPELAPWGRAFLDRAEELVRGSDAAEPAIFAAVSAALTLLDVTWLVVGTRRES